jgi:4-amino-4-deoxy-L-arabinose transferase-like glycosyltransferase
MSKRNHHIILALLLVVYLVNGIAAIPSLSVTHDEGDHLSYGARVLKLHPEKVVPFEDASTMPVSGVNALPRAVEQVLTGGSLHKTDGGVSDILMGRYMTLLVCLLICLLVYRWTKEIAGDNAALLALVFTVFCPNLNANNYLVTTDSYAALLTLASGYFFYRFLCYSSWKDFVLFSAAIGFSQATKQSLILLFFFFGILSLLVLIKRKTLFSHFRINLWRLAVFVAVVLLVINTAFLFSGSGRALANYDFKSGFFLQMKSWPVISQLPLPLPAPFVDGFDQVKYMLGLGSGHAETSPRSYLFGMYFTGNGPWYYYPCVILFKTPLSIWVSFIILAALLFSRKIKNRMGVLFPLILAFFFIGSVILLNTSQHSVRHLLMIYPLFYVSLGCIAAREWKGCRPILGIILVYSVATFYSYFPNVISYTNELLWNKTMVYKTLASSNIDFGQGRHLLDKFLAKNPGVTVAPLQPGSGRFVLGINEYLDLRATGNYAWLRNFEPVSHIDHCYLLFEITPDDLNKARPE